MPTVAAAEKRRGSCTRVCCGALGARVKMIFNSSPPQHHSSTPTTNHNTNHNYTNHELHFRRRLCSLGSACGRRWCASPTWACTRRAPPAAGPALRTVRGAAAAARGRRERCQQNRELTAAAPCRSHPLRAARRATCRADRCAARRTRSLLRRTLGCRELGHCCIVTPHYRNALSHDSGSRGPCATHGHGELSFDQQALRVVATC